MPPKRIACSSDGEPLSTLAAKVPAAKKTGDRAVDDKSGTQRDALVWIIDRLQKNMHEAPRLQSYILSSAFAGSAQTSGDGWTGAYKSLGDLPKDYLVRFVLKRSADLKLGVVNSSLLKQLELSDASSIQAVFGMDIQLPMSLSLPPTMVEEEEVCTRVLTARCDEVGHRLKSFSEKGGFQQAGKLDLKAAGCYSFVFKGDMAVQVVHISGETANIPPHAPISKGFSIRDNDCDWKASAVLLPTEHLLHKFFPQTAAFRKVMYAPGKKCLILKGLGKLIGDKIAEERKAGSLTTESTGEALKAVQQAQTEKRKENLKRARTKLGETMKGRKASRTISLA